MMRKYLIYILTLINVFIVGQTHADTLEIRCIPLEKSFINELGTESEKRDIFLRFRNGEVFVKLCEGTVTANDFKPHFGHLITVKLEIKEGEWDSCEGDPVVNSRMGTYVAVYGIIDTTHNDETGSAKLKSRDHIMTKDPDSLKYLVIDLLKSVHKMDTNDFIGSFMPFEYYMEMAADTSVHTSIRQGMSMITPAQFRRRYVLGYERLTRSISDLEVNTKAIKLESFELSMSDDGGLKGAEGVLVFKYRGESYSIRILCIYRDEYWNLVEMDRIVSYRP